MDQETARPALTAIRKFRVRTALQDEIRTGELRVRRAEGGWEVQAYLLQRPGTDPFLVHEEKMGTGVVFQAATSDEAAGEMLRHLRQYFELDIEEGAGGKKP